MPARRAAVAGGAGIRRPPLQLLVQERLRGIAVRGRGGRLRFDCCRRAVSERGRLHIRPCLWGGRDADPPATRSTFNIACRVTAGSHIPGTERSPAVTSGHAGIEICIQEEHGGYRRIWPDTPSRRFGTVRPRIHIPGTRPICEFRTSWGSGQRDSSAVWLHNFCTNFVPHAWRAGECIRITG